MCAAPRHPIALTAKHLHQEPIMTRLVGPLHRPAAGRPTAAGRRPTLLRCLAAALLLWWVGAAAAENNPGAMKGYALQEYLKGQRWQSIPRPAPSAPFVYPLPSRRVQPVQQVPELAQVVSDPAPSN